MTGTGVGCYGEDLDGEDSKSKWRSHNLVFLAALALLTLFIMIECAR